MTIIQATEKLKQLFNENWMADLARKTKLCERQRDLRPLELTSSLLACLGDGKVDAIADLHRGYNSMQMGTPHTVAYKPFHNKLRKPGFAKFTRAVTERAMALFRREVKAALPDKLNQFRELILQDGSSFALHPELADTFPGRFTTTSPAAVECHLRMSLREESPLYLAISEDKASERDYLPRPDTLCGCLLMADAGYPRLDYFAEMDKHRASFLMRAGKQFNPRIAKATTGNGKALPKLEGLKVQEVRRRLSRAKMLDLDMVWDCYQCRMIIFWHKEEKRYLWWLTNLSRETFSGEDVMKLYRARWQIELLFKEWKSYNNLKRLVTRQPHLIEGLIWASLLSLLVKRFIGRTTQRIKRVELSMLKLAKTTRGWFEPMMRSLGMKSYKQLEVEFLWAIDFLATNALRARQSKSKQNNSLRGIYDSLSA